MTSATANKRLIARLDVKMTSLIKGIQLEGWRKVGDPEVFARRYYEEGVDELFFIDVVASLYERNNLTDVVRHTASHAFVPITVGGGVRTVEDARTLLSVGADKVAINTAATADPQIIRQLSETFGSQAIVLNIEAKRKSRGGWECMTDNGRNKTGRDPVEWVEEAVSLGAGEVLIASVDEDGRRRGMDWPLIDAVAAAVSTPVIACSGVGTTEHVVRALTQTRASAVAIGAALHYGDLRLPELRAAASAKGAPLRMAARGGER